MAGEINWNLLNPNTPAQVAGSFQQGQANRLAMQQAEQEKAANALTLQSKQQAMADEQAVRQAYAQSGGDPNKLVESLRGAGQHQKAFEMQGQMSAQQAAQRKAQIEEGLQHIQVVGQLAGGVTDQATYDAARQQIASLYGPEAAAKMPEVYDPNAVNQFRTQALKVSEQLEQQWKALDYGMKREQFSFDKQKFGATQGLEREKMRQSAAQHAQTQQIEIAKLGNKMQGESEQKNQAAINAQQAIDQAAELFKHPGRQAGTGASSFLSAIPGTEAKGFQANLDTFKAQTFIPMVAALKGMGALSDAEGKKLSESVGALNPDMPEKEFEASLKKVTKTLYNKAKAGGLNVTLPAFAVDTSHPAEISDLLKKYGG